MGEEREEHPRRRRARPGTSTSTSTRHLAACAVVLAVVLTSSTIITPNGVGIVDAFTYQTSSTHSSRLVSSSHKSTYGGLRTLLLSAREAVETQPETKDTLTSPRVRIVRPNKSEKKGASSSASATQTKDSSASQQASSTTDLLPPWLARYAKVTPRQAKQEVDWLEYALREQGFSTIDISQITQQLETIAGGDAKLATGMVDFLRLLLRLVEREDAVGTVNQDVPGFVSKEVLLASLLHYAECIAARREGLQEWIRAFLSQPVNSKALPPSSSSSSATTAFDSIETPDIPAVKTRTDTSPNVQVVEDSQEPSIFRHANDRLADTDSGGTSLLSTTEIIRAFNNDEVLQIAKGAARIKRAEIMAQAVAGLGGALSEQDASRLRGLLLSFMDDWRSLAIRCVACLYRLEGILLHRGGGAGTKEYMTRTPEMVQTAREAIRVYATLAQRLGMHRLQHAIEERAFRILYRRQYEAVSSLYREKGEAMQSVSSYLLSKITDTLHQDESLMAQLEELQVTARVKEPFSFWKKLLKAKSAEGATDGTSRKTLPSSTSNALAMTEVQDGVALRIILRARKGSEDESDETTRARERMLCYYAQELIRSKWPASDETRIKDYIQDPKANGYQSLHYTSSISSRGFEFPFEVQVRSEEMHRLAEFGVASHWDYKLGNKSAPGTKAEAVPFTTVSIKEASSVAGLLAPAEDTATAISNPPPATESSALSVGPYVDALVTAKDAEQQVYVFLADEDKGKLITLPTNSQVRDAITVLDCGGKPTVWLNGRTALLNDAVGNGDLLLVKDGRCFE